MKRLFYLGAFQENIPLAIDDHARPKVIGPHQLTHHR